MFPTAGIVFAAALLLAVAGVAKVTRPAATQVALRTAGLPSSQPLARLLGIAELVFAVVSLAIGGVAGAVLVALAYLGFAGFSAQLLRRSRGTASCGCFGGDDAPVTGLHIWLNVVLAAAAIGSLADPTPAIWDAAGLTPWGGAPFLLLVALLAWLLLVALTDLPAAMAAARRTSTAAPTTGTASSKASGLTIGAKPESIR